MDWQNAIFGPGWVWSLLSMVLVVGSLLGLYRQLQLQHDAAATEQLNSLLGEWSSERMCRAKLTVLLAIEAGVEPEKLPHRAVSHVGFFWQRIGYLVRTGHMDRKLVHRHLGPQVQMWLAWLGPNDWEDFVWMAETSAAMDAAQKVAPWLDSALLADHVPASITHFRDAIELEEALRTVTVRLTPTPIPVRTERAAEVTRRPADG